MREHPVQSELSRPVPPAAVLSARLDALRRRQLRVAAGAGLATVAAAGLLLPGLEMLLDYWVGFSWTARALLLMALVAVLCVVAVLRLVLPLLHRPGPDELALMVERRVPSFRTRLIAAVQLTRPGAAPRGTSPSLVQALVAETAQLAGPMDFASLVPTGELRKAAAWAATALAAMGLVLFLGGQDAHDLLNRVFLSNTPVPRKTRVAVADGDKKIGRGDSVVIEALAQGLLPASGSLVIRSMIWRGQEFVMERTRNTPNRYVRSIENVQQSFSYVVKLGDGASRMHRVEVIPRPTVVSLQCEQTYPSYTGLPPVRRSPGDLVLLAGSRLRFTVTASKPLRKASARLEGLDQSVPLAVDSKDPAQAVGTISIPPTNLTGFALELLDQQGMASREPAVYHVEALPDKPPAARILAPERKEELVTQAASLLVEFVAEDDFQVARVWLRYRAAGEEKAATNSVELELAGSEGPRVRRTFPWKAASISPPVTPGARLEYWIEAADNNNVTGPGLGASDHQMLRIVTPEEKRAELLARAGDYLTTINDVAGDEEKLSQGLSELILPKSQPPPPAKEARPGGQ
jgi:hypothetical protein